jgi:hypothetical protein
MNATHSSCNGYTNRYLLTISMLFIWFTSQMHAQSGKPETLPQAKFTERNVWVPYWSEQNNEHATLHVRNALHHADLQVRIDVLGTEGTVVANRLVFLKRLESFDIALSMLLPAGSAQAARTGAIRINYSYPYDGALQAELSVRDDQLNKAFTIVGRSAYRGVARSAYVAVHVPSPDTYLEAVSRAYSEVYWSVEGDFVPLITVANFGSEEDLLSVYTSQAGSLVELVSSKIPPKGSMTLNLRDLVAALRTKVSFNANYGGLYIRSSKPSGKLLVKQHALSASRLIMVPYYGSTDYITQHEWNYYPSNMWTGEFSTASTQTCHVHSGCVNDEHAIYSQNTSIVHADNSGMGFPAQIEGFGEGTTYFTSTACCDQASNPVAPTSPPAQINVACSYPTNFTQTQGSGSGGTLTFRYSWSSSSGNKAHLIACTVQEWVAYPSAPPTYTFPRPPFPSITIDNPTIEPNPGAWGAGTGIVDTHSTPGAFATPFPVGTTEFTANQRFIYKCPCRNGGNPVFFYPLPAGTAFLEIFRKVDAVSTSSGTFTVSKSGVSSSKAVP